MRINIIKHGLTSEKKDMEINILGFDNTFKLGVFYLLDELERKYDFRKKPIRLKVHVFYGMTLPEIYRFNKEISATTRLPCEAIIVICSPACKRMLKGTQGYEQALFLTSIMSGQAMQFEIMEWLSMGDWKKPLARNVAVKVIQKHLIYMLLRGRTVKEEACYKHYKIKTLYTQLSQLSQKIGTNSQQELYFKVLIMNEQSMFDIV